MVANEIKRKIYEKYIEKGEKELQEFEEAKVNLVDKRRQIAQLEAEIEVIEHNISGYNYSDTQETLQILYQLVDELDAKCSESAAAEDVKDEDVQDEQQEYIEAENSNITIG